MLLFVNVVIQIFFVRHPTVSINAVAFIVYFSRVTISSNSNVLHMHHLPENAENDRIEAALFCKQVNGIVNCKFL